MKKIRRWLGLALVLLVGGLLVAAFLEPTQIVRGFLAGDSFYRGRPSRYWREYLREDGRSGKVSRSNVRQFRDTRAAFAVLCKCASDPDRNVRWPAITLFGHGGERSEKILSVLVHALDDDDMEVRLQANRALAYWGSMARSAVPALANRLNDPEL